MQRRSWDASTWVLAATILASAMAFIDGSVVGVALPVLQVELGTTVAGAQWVVEVNTLFLGTLILLGGSLGDYMGRRLVFSVGVALFAAGSLWAGLAPSLGPLIAARAVAGLGGALLVPNSLAIIGATFEGVARGRAVGTWAGLTSAAAALAPIVGGWLVESISWRAVFLLNLPLALVVLAIVGFRMPPDGGSASRHALDLPGALLAIAALAGLVFGLIEGPVLGWRSAPVLGASALSIVGGVLFVLRERRARAPMVPLGLFRSRTFSGVNILTFLVYGGLYSVFFYLPFNLIQVQGYSATAAGAALLPVVGLLTVLSRWAGELSERIGPRRVLMLGAGIAGLGMGGYALPHAGGSYWATFFPPAVLLGLGMSLTVAPLTTTVLSSVGVEHTGVASGINNTAARVAALVTIAVLGILITQVFAVQLSVRLAASDVPQEVKEMVYAQRHDLAALQPPVDLDPEQQRELRQAIEESYVAGFRLSMIAIAAMALMGAAIASRLEAGQPARPERDRPS